MNDASARRVALALVSHTNVGKTTLARTLLGRDVGTVRDAPHVTALATAMAGASGLFGSLAEGFALTRSLVEGMKSESELIRSLTVREEAMDAQRDLRDRLQDMVKGKPFEQAKAAVRDAAIERVQSAIDVLARKGVSEDLAAYRSFVQGIGTRVAESAKEGGFLGFGGERISAGEQDMLARLNGALGTHSA